MTKHLDIGCGITPRNPYNQQSVWGVDITIPDSLDQNQFIACNVCCEPLPFPDNYFDSVSAYDFLEHVPRQLFLDGQLTLPFLNLINEIYRILKPNGLFYAVTPAFPSEEAFVDPTHVNIITRKTHRYFTAPHYMANMYGFVGKFASLRVQWIRFDKSVSYQPHSLSISKSLRSFFDTIFKKKNHLLWEFKKLV